MKCLGRRIPHVQLSENMFNNLGFVYARDDAHRGTAVGTLERIALVNFLNQLAQLTLCRVPVAYAAAAPFL